MRHGVCRLQQGCRDAVLLPPAPLLSSPSPSRCRLLLSVVIYRYFHIKKARQPNEHTSVYLPRVDNCDFPTPLRDAQVTLLVCSLPL